MKAVVNESKLTCPGCGYSEVLTMPADACQWYHQCNGCHRLLKPNPEDCCVFCSFGSMPCPPKQAASDHDDSDRG
ncbi:MAG TPA: GDCCVxC domain-containing (seleno)protein [Gammaproteobacteria bacterium]|nr:GDCCVxC domain-containing (seleno)protein [Gammaproteobacteria bacterium]